MLCERRAYPPGDTARTHKQSETGQLPEAEGRRYYGVPKAFRIYYDKAFAPSVYHGENLLAILSRG